MNISEIAKRANVSRATVSRVINNLPGVRPQTKQIIEQVIKEVNYIPNAAARTLASKKSNNVGALVFNITNPFWAGIVSGIENGIAQSENSLFIVNSKSHADVWDYKKVYKLNLRNLIQRGVDGVIIALANDLDGEDIDLLEAANISYVVIQNHLDDRRVKSVDVNNMKGAYDAVMHLVKLGHSSIFHVTGPLDSGIARERLRGFIKAMEDAGLPFTDEHLISSGFRFNDGYWGMKQIFARPEWPTAVLFPNDNAVFGAYHAANEASVKIPNEISVIGFDHITQQIEYASLLPDLTTMQSPVENIGFASVEMLLSMMRGEKPSQTVISFDMRLHEGVTCKGLTPS